MDSDCPFGIFKLFLKRKEIIKNNIKGLVRVSVENRVIIAN